MCSISLKFSLPGHFISHSVPSSLKASFESINGPMNFSYYDIDQSIYKYIYKCGVLV